MNGGSALIQLPTGDKDNIVNDTNPNILPDTRPLEISGDPAALMVEGIHTFFQDRLDDASNSRKSVFQSMIVDGNESHDLENRRHRLEKLLAISWPDTDTAFKEVLPADHSDRTPFVTAESFTVKTVRWRTHEYLEAEGLLIEPESEPVADIIALPDCDEVPEFLLGINSDLPVERQWLLRLARLGYRIVIPVLINRNDEHSGIPSVGMTNQPHREFIYRAAYQLGRYIIGMELEKIKAAAGWLKATAKLGRKTAVIGYGEGGLLALFAGALLPEFDLTLTSGYFADRNCLPDEPIYRNVWGLLNEFDDVHFADLINNRNLIIESCRHPEVDGPPAVREGRRGGAAPGFIRTPSLADRTEAFESLSRKATSESGNSCIQHIVSGDGAGEPFCDQTIQAIRDFLSPGKSIDNQDVTIKSNYPSDPAGRHTRQYRNMIDYLGQLTQDAEFNRARFWQKPVMRGAETWDADCRDHRTYFHREIIGELPSSDMPLNPRSRLIYDDPSFLGYEVMLDVYDEVFAYGIILIPRNISDGEKRPVVVCQHGLEGRPQDVADPVNEHEAYRQYACRLAEKGYVAYAPQNPYIGGNTFREILRKAHPLKQSLYAVIVRQHERTLEWLSSLAFVDSGRIAFYGLSYGGKTAMRIPALIPQYCLSICSADYNEWIWKNVSTRHAYSYLISGEYDMPEFNLANTFNYAEMSRLICPRPFMVERGHDDGVAPDEWVAYEYAKTRRHYVKLGIGDKTECEVFDGPHAINSEGTFKFLDAHLKFDPDIDQAP